MRHLRSLLAVACFLLASVGSASADCAWILWDHVTGAVGKRPIDFWLMLEPTESRKQCIERAEAVSDAESGLLKNALLTEVLKAEVRPGWARRRTAAGYEERAPEGQRGVESHRLTCWPTGTDPRR